MYHPHHFKEDEDLTVTGLVVMVVLCLVMGAIFHAAEAWDQLTESFRHIFLP